MKTVFTQLRSVRAAFAGLRCHPYLHRREPHWLLLQPVYVRGSRNDREGKLHGRGIGQVPPVCETGRIVPSSVLRALGVVPRPGLPLRLDSPVYFRCR